jgi:hypothetical protein
MTPAQHVRYAEALLSALHHPDAPMRADDQLVLVHEAQAHALTGIGLLIADQPAAGTEEAPDGPTG